MLRNADIKTPMYPEKHRFANSRKLVVSVAIVAVLVTLGILNMVLNTQTAGKSQPAIEMYSMDFEPEKAEWEWRPSGEGYAWSRDTEVVHEGSASARLQSIVAQPPDEVSVTRMTLPAQPYIGKRIRYSAYVKTEGVDEWAALWLNTSLYGAVLDFDNMSDRPLHSTLDWKRYEIVLTVPRVDYLNFGVLMQNTGRVWIDEVRLEEVGTGVPVTGRDVHDKPCNLDFEGQPACWYEMSNQAHLYTGGLDTAVAHTGRTSGFLTGEPSGKATATLAELSQAIYTGQYAGKRIRYSAYVKAEDVKGGASLRSGVRDMSNETQCFGMKDEPIKGTSDWQKYEVVTDIPGDSRWFSIDLVLVGSGQAWIDDAEFEVVDTSVPVTGESVSCVE